MKITIILHDYLQWYWQDVEDEKPEFEEEYYEVFCEIETKDGKKHVVGDSLIVRPLRQNEIKNENKNYN